jgi:hypothetical protein
MKWSEEHIVFCTYGDAPCSNGWAETVRGLGEGNYQLKCFWNPVEINEGIAKGELIWEKIVRVEHVCKGLIAEDYDVDRSTNSEDRKRIAGVMGAAEQENDQGLAKAVEAELQEFDEYLRECE